MIVHSGKWVDSPAIDPLSRMQEGAAWSNPSGATRNGAIAALHEPLHSSAIERLMRLALVPVASRLNASYFQLRTLGLLRLVGRRRRTRRAALCAGKRKRTAEHRARLVLHLLLHLHEHVLALCHVVAHHRLHHRRLTREELRPHLRPEHLALVQRLRLL